MPKSKRAKLPSKQMLNYLDAYVENKVHETIRKCREEMLEKWLEKIVTQTVTSQLPKAVNAYNSKKEESIVNALDHLNQAVHHISEIYEFKLL